MDDDFELLKAWRDGDGHAGDQLFRRHFARIYRFFRSKVPDAAEDLSQRTFLALIENKEKMWENTSFRAYAFGIARNQLLMHFRRLGHGRERALESQTVFELTGSGVETGLRKGEELRLVLRAMQRLPMEFQMALELYYWEDFSVSEIADALGIPSGTVKSRLWRGRELLREAIEACEAPADLRASTLGELNKWIAALRKQLPDDEGSS